MYLLQVSYTTSYYQRDLLSDLKDGASIPSLVPSSFRATDRNVQERPVKGGCLPFLWLTPTSPTCCTEVRSTVVASSTVTVLLMSEEAFFVQKSYSSSPALTLSTNLEFGALRHPVTIGMLFYSYMHIVQFIIRQN